VAATEVFNHFSELSPNQKKQFDQLFELYSDWNEKINVISRKDISNLYLNHVLHSLAIAKVINFKPGTKVLDVGTGGGFPGIPLAIFFPETTFHMVDSVGKKIKVVDAVSEALELKNTLTTHGRAEAIDDQFDFVVSRAVTRLDVFSKWVHGKFLKNSFNEIQNGILYLKGGDFKDELRGVKYKLYPIEPMFGNEFFKDKYVVHLPR